MRIAYRDHLIIPSLQSGKFIRIYGPDGSALLRVFPESVDHAKQIIDKHMENEK
tara:strand:- start:389 stop:550 length:162 start_codon:yes stop_codon:yes gene_type:complete